MKITVPVGSYCFSVSLHKKEKKVITYLPESDLLKILREHNKAAYHADEAGKKRLQNFQQELNDTSFWAGDSGYAFIEQHLPEEPFTLLDVGCNIGQLPYFLKAKSVWDRVSYTGTDLNPSMVELAEKAHPKGRYLVSDIQQQSIEEHFDLMLTKGTIISTFDPVASLKNVLSIPSDRKLLVHTALSDIPLDQEYYNILVSSRETVYPSSVLSQEAFYRYIENSGLRVADHHRRPTKFEVENKGSYRLHDFLLT